MAQKLDILLCPSGLTIGGAQFNRVERLVNALREQTRCRNVFITPSHRSSLQNQWPFYPDKSAPPYSDDLCRRFKNLWSNAIQRFKTTEIHPAAPNVCSANPPYNEVVGFIVKGIPYLHDRRCVNLLADCAAPCDLCKTCNLVDASLESLKQYDYHFWYPRDLPMAGAYPFVPDTKWRLHPKTNERGDYVDEHGHQWVRADHQHPVFHWDVQHDGTYTKVTDEGGIIR